MVERRIDAEVETPSNMHSVMPRLYVFGSIIALLNLGLAVWLDGPLGMVNIFSALLVSTVLVWSAFGAPGSTRLETVWFDS